MNSVFKLSPGSVVKNIVKTERRIDKENFRNFEIELTDGSYVNCLMTHDLNIVRERMTEDDFGYSFHPTSSLDQLLGAELKEIRLVLDPDYKKDNISLIQNEENEKYLQVCYLQLVSDKATVNLVASVYRGKTNNQYLKRFLDNLMFGQLVMNIKVGTNAKPFDTVDMKIEHELRPL